MLDTSNSIALTAFIVSLVALTVTLLQLLQQYFATAQGYNRCSRRLIGDWSRFRHRHYLWREFRFEVTFVRPYIYLGNLNPSHPIPDTEGPSATWHNLFSPSRRDQKWRAKYLGRSMSISELPGELTDACTQASWTLFLKHLQEYNRHAARRMQHASYEPPSPSTTTHSPSSTYGICIKFEPCTWDDLPGNPGTLTGSVSLRDLTIFTRLLGLNWSGGPFMSSLQRSASKEESKSSTSLSPRGSLQASGNTLILAERSTPLLRYEQQDFTPPRLHLSRRETFIIHPGAVAMFYGRILLDPVLFPAHSQSVVLDGDQAWETLSSTMWLPLPPRASLVNILPALCSAILSERDLYSVRVPRPHRYLLGPFTRPKIAMIFKRGVEGIQSQQQQQQEGSPSSVVDGILEAINELEQFPRPQQHPAPHVSDYWTVSQGAYPAWATDLETSPEASFFNERVHHWLSWIQQELSQLVSREDDYIRPYSFFHWDLVSSFLEFIVAFEGGGEEAAAQDDHDENPVATWRRNMHALFDHLPTIEAHVRRRGRRRAEMCANGYHMSPTTGLGDQFDVVISCEGVVGYDQVGSEEIRDACLGMIFRAMCWHRCHYMSPEDEPFRSDFYGNIQQVGIE
ncbi:uncharacterized protein BO95DRAFT_412583 [Aspergillus brunneoviolaceus CBS 621.78]|uniref:Uncharacterized protein n=1 Tax=Aspergillus brunneoviolaceus CBS 621.78 TaxID=1450534 RepID=A0ACD1GAP2_9EURO|nr:hypothetical protein BO95DRAFT_412583 [Aspergillus brunneoviolaceus CBS 621.78]RAH46171.1 hypothetical protein BO95DRAFT_412583 [Aspergillus brunneoviolaceus CBS 621.78]